MFPNMLFYIVFCHLSTGHNRF